MAHTIAARKDTIDAGMTDAARTFDNTRAQRRSSAVIDARSPWSARDRTRRRRRSRRWGRRSPGPAPSAGKTVDAVGADVQRFTAETLPELERLLGELSVLSTSLRRLIEQTERDPRGLLFGRKPVPTGPGE